MLTALFQDTVERHISPARYRVEKVAHVALLSFLLPAIAAGVGYWLVSVGMALRSGPFRPADKARDLLLALVPACLLWNVGAGLALFVVAFLLPLRD